MANLAHKLLYTSGMSWYSFIGFRTLKWLEVHQTVAQIFNISKDDRFFIEGSMVVGVETMVIKS
jgi:hypothetical protein